MRSELLAAMRLQAMREGLPNVMGSLGLQGESGNAPSRASAAQIVSTLETLRRSLHLYEVEFYDQIATLAPDLAERFLVIGKRSVQEVDEMGMPIARS